MTTSDRLRRRQPNHGRPYRLMSKSNILIADVWKELDARGCVVYKLYASNATMLQTQDILTFSVLVYHHKLFP